MKSSKSESAIIILFLSVVFIFFIIAQLWDTFNVNDSQKAVVAFMGGAIVFVWGFTQYYQGQQWKKTEFLANEYKSFVTDPYVQRAMRMLDFPRSDFKLLEDEVELYVSAGLLKKTLACDFDTMQKAFSNEYDDEQQRDYDIGANIIRYTFDQFIIKMGLFQKYIDAGVVERKDIITYLDYWIKMIVATGNEKERFPNNAEKFLEMKKQIIRFIDRYDYNGFKKLAGQFGYGDFKKICTSYGIVCKSSEFK